MGRVGGLGLFKDGSVEELAGGVAVERGLLSGEDRLLLLLEGGDGVGVGMSEVLFLLLVGLLLGNLVEVHRERVVAAGI